MTELKCTNPEAGKLIGRYELGALDDALREEFVKHLLECEFCHNELLVMAPFTDVLREYREAVMRGEVPAPSRRAPAQPRIAAWRRANGVRLAAAASLVVAISVGALICMYQLMKEPGEDQGAALQLPGGVTIPKAPFVAGPEVPVTRSQEFGDTFQRAMAAYERDDFATAAERLEVLCRLVPDHADAQFYWGVSLLFAGRPDDAIVPLRKAIRLNTGHQQEACRFYLAAAYVKSGRMDEALAELGNVIALGGQHGEDAEKLKSIVTRMK
ncbi:MAG: CDC27 family protein [Acidobacteriota bacterium]